MPKADSDYRTINRICDLLNSFNEVDKILSLTEISRRIGLPKSTTYRFIEALVSQGILIRDAHGRGYQLGYQLIRWGTLAQSAIDLRNIALPVLYALAEETGETTILSVRYGNAGIWIEMVESQQPVRLAMRVGKPLKLHAGASSKVLLAFLPEAEIECILAEIELVPLEVNTITDREAMRAELQRIRERGYAISYEETDRGAMGIAAPIYDHTCQPTAGIGIVAPIARVPASRVEELAKPLLAASRELSKRLGSAV